MNHFPSSFPTPFSVEIERMHSRTAADLQCDAMLKKTFQILVGSFKTMNPACRLHSAADARMKNVRKHVYIQDTNSFLLVKLNCAQGSLWSNMHLEATLRVVPSQDITPIIDALADKNAAYLVEKKRTHKLTFVKIHRLFADISHSPTNMLTINILASYFIVWNFSSYGAVH